MNRDIKFRGKDIDTENWVEGAIYKHEPPLQCIGENKEKSMFYILKTAFADWGMPRNINFFGVDPKTIGQYTGLKDKNGVEIYEGDIFHLGDINILYKVIWNDAGMMGKQIKSTSYVGLNYWGDKIEVTGNIYENPELLEVE